MDELHAGNPHNERLADPPIPASDIGRLTRGIHFYDSMVVLEKGAFLTKVSSSIPVVPGQQVW